jgi:predicted ATPase/DNA-binding SARP family transcriptional activator
MPVDIRLFGGLVVRVDEQPVASRYEAGLLLLAWLALHPGRDFTRDALAALLWPDPPLPVARRRLREVLFSLRRALGDADRSPPVLVLGRDRVALGVGWTCDAAALAATWAEVLRHAHRRLDACASCCDRLESVVSAGELLAGVRLPEGRFADEVAARRDHLRQVRTEVWVAVGTRALEAGDAARALAAAQRAAEEEPLAETALRLQLQALARSGRRAEALAVYDAHAARLEALDRPPPDDATEELYQAIRHEDPVDRARGRVDAPAPPTGLTGRDPELRQLDGLLARDDVRLVTLTGLGGVGKTRLALEAAHRHGPAFRDGARFVAAGETRTAAELALALQAALGLAGTRAPVAVLVDWLRGRELLLILDELEGNDGAAELVSALLAGARTLRVLTTCRTRLGLRAEHTVPLGGLAPDAAARLLVERARQVRPSLALDPEEVRDLCATLGGLPLAIELAAARVDGEALLDIHRAAADGLRLAGGPVDLPAHQRDLRALVGGSVARLTPPDRDALAALAVFRGPFDAEDARSVAAADADALARMVHHSLLAAVGPGEHALHPLVAAYGRATCTEPEAVATRHRHRVLTTLERGDRTWWVRRRDEVRAAFASALDQGDLALVAAAAWPLARRLRSVHGWHDADAWFGRAVTLLGAGDRTHPAFRRCLVGAGGAAFRLGRHEEAVGQLETALTLSRAAQDPLDTGQAARTLGFALRNAGYPAAAVPLLAEAADRFDEARAAVDAAGARYDRATALYETGDLASARGALASAAAELAALGDGPGATAACSVLGLCEVLSGAPEVGLRRLTEAVRAHRSLDDAGVANSLNALACAEVLTCRWAAAARHATAAAKAYADSGFLPGVASTETWLAMALVGAGRRAEAAASVDRAVGAALALGTARPLLEAAAAVAWWYAGPEGVAVPGATDRPARLVATVLAHPEPIAELRAAVAPLARGLAAAPPFDPESLRACLVREVASVRRA